jgi:hypothetical protein
VRFLILFPAIAIDLDLDLHLHLRLRTHGRWYARQHDSDAARVAVTTTNAMGFALV